MSSCMKTALYGNEVNKVKEDKQLMARLLVVARTRELDLEELMSHSLSTTPPSLSTADGSLQLTPKSTMLHHLERLHPETIFNQAPKGSALILGGMAVIEHLADFVPGTF